MWPSASRPICADTCSRAGTRCCCSNYGGASEFWGQLRRRGLAMAVVAQKSYINEKLTLLKVDVRES